MLWTCCGLVADLLRICQKFRTHGKGKPPRRRGDRFDKRHCVWSYVGVVHGPVTTCRSGLDTSRLRGTAGATGPENEPLPRPETFAASRRRTARSAPSGRCEGDRASPPSRCSSPRSRYRDPVRRPSVPRRLPPALASRMSSAPVPRRARRAVASRTRQSRRHSPQPRPQ